MKNEILHQYNPWWEEDYNPVNIISRENYIKELQKYCNNKSIVFLTGMRRVGKTTLAKLLIMELLKKKIPKNYIFYISLDDYLVNNISIIEIINSYRTLHKLKTEEKIYVFLDEITYKKDYQQQLKNLYDLQNIKIFATSSSSSLLKDKKAYLTGRTITIEIQPLSFEEYLIFKKIKIKNRDAHLYDSYFEDFIKEGGLPESVLHYDRQYLMNLVDDIIQKDITAFYALKNSQIVKDFFVLLMDRSGKQISINKIANILKISPDTARRYLNYFESTYLIHLVPRWGKTNERLLSPKKVYACDLGIKYLFMGKRDLGSYFENYIYLKIKKDNNIFYLYENGIEIDFITQDKVLIESKYNSTMNEKQKILFDSFKAKKKIVIDSVKKLLGPF